MDDRRTVSPAALLQRIGLDAPVAPTVAGLVGLHRAYLERVPYENLDIQLGRAAPLDLATIAARVLQGGRGGYCFEVNGLLALLLEAAGFDLTRHEAVVGPREDLDAPTNHLALVVHLGGARYLADAGLGEGLLDPVPLQPGRHAQGDLHWDVEDQPDGGWWIGQHEWGSVPGFRIAREPVAYRAFAPHHERLSTSPDSPFVQTLVVQRPHADRIVTLRARTLSQVGPGFDDKVVLGDPDAFADTLRERFGIDPGVLGPQAMETLWRRSGEQHERYLASRG